MRTANARGEALGLSEDELAFYDALETNDSAVKVLGDATLCAIARELVATVRNNVTIDWTLRESAQAKIRVMVKRLRCAQFVKPAPQPCRGLLRLGGGEAETFNADQFGDTLGAHASVEAGNDAAHAVANQIGRGVG